MKIAWDQGHTSKYNNRDRVYLSKCGRFAILGMRYSLPFSAMGYTAYDISAMPKPFKLESVNHDGVRVFHAVADTLAEAKQLVAAAIQAAEGGNG